MRKLAVGASKKQRRRSTEHRFEQRVANCLTEMGIWNYHACPDWSPGIPDRYLQGGRWIEFKSLAYRDSFTWKYRIFPNEQGRKLEELWRAGDKPYVCILLHHDDDEHPRLLLQPWPEFRVTSQWTREMVVQECPLIFSDGELKLRLHKILNGPYSAT
jgi:hypothetical protein